MNRTVIEMFNMELEGKFGELRQHRAVKQIKEMEEDYENGKFTIKNGAAIWKCGNYLPVNCLAPVINGKYGYLIDVDEHERLLDEQQSKSIREFKERMKNRVCYKGELIEDIFLEMD